MIPFNKPAVTGNEKLYILDSIKSDKISGDGKYTKKCQKWFLKTLGCKTALLTPSCTHALEMAAILLNIQEGDEIIMPSYTFVSTANAFVLRGATIVFVDVRPDTMNIDEKKIEQAITKKTKAIVPMHYAGVSCEMDFIMEIANRYNLFVVEDAAQAMMSYYKGKPLGTIGHLGTFSFHETKNYTSAGEGGLLIVNDPQFVKRAEIIREKGTNRAQFFQGLVDKYTWIDIGSSYLLNDISAAYLWANLKSAKKINSYRLKLWFKYHKQLKLLEKKGFIQLPTIPNECIHNGHIFYIKVQNQAIRSKLLEYLREKNIFATFHYLPLHTSPISAKFSRFVGNDNFTTIESNKLIRLPIYYHMKTSELNKVCQELINFYLK